MSRMVRPESELVDHLASIVEQRKSSLWATWELNSKKFGVFGFMDVVENDRLFRQKNTIRLAAFQRFFSIPKIILTVAMTLPMLFC
jgi:hypothetical protein